MPAKSSLLTSRSLQSCTDGHRKNNLNIFRLALALLVVFAHSFTLTGSPEPLKDWSRDQATFGPLAVDMFFFISGLLITSSWFNSKTMNIYLRRRIFRIFPGFCVALFFSFLVAVAFANHPMESIRTHLGTVIKDLVSLDIKSLEGDWIFPHNLFPNAVNGSLWTIRYEFICYLLIAVFGLFCFLKHRKALLMVLVLFYAFDCYVLFKGGSGVKLKLDRPFYVFFLLGMFSWLWRDKIPVNAGLSVVALVILLVSMLKPPLFSLLGPFVVSYLVLTVSFLIPNVKMFTWAERTDLSYGAYLYAFPIQQLVAGVGHVTSPMMMFCIATPLVLGTAWLSWTFVEKRFLKLKSWEFIDHDPGSSGKPIPPKSQTEKPINTEGKISW